MRRHAKAVFVLAMLCSSFAFAAPASGAGAACPNEAIRAQQGAAFLPECRAWEKVSPADKGDTDVYTAPSATFVSPDGSRAIFRADGVDGEEAKSSDLVGDFRSVRTSSGWSTASLGEPLDVDVLRPQTDLRIGYRDYSEDLGSGILIQGDPALTPGAQPGVRNIYRVDIDGKAYDLLSPPILNLSEVDPFTALFYQPVFADSSSDAGRVLFESTQRLTADAPTTVNGAYPAQSGHLYEWAEGGTRLVGLVPPPGEGSCGAEGEPTCLPAPQGAVAGRGANTAIFVGAADTGDAMSEDGSRIYFTTPDQPSGSPNNLWRGQIYLRRDGTSTVHVSRSRRTDCATSPGSCAGVPEPDPAGVQPAEFSGATPDGTVAFFNSCEKLTDDSTASCTGEMKRDLYRYDAASDELTDLTATQAGMSGTLGVLNEVVGLADDGSIVYFFSDRSDELSLWAAHAGGGLTQAATGLSTEDTLTIGSRLRWLSNGRTTAVSRDGRYLAYSKTVNGHPTLYLYDAEADVTSCVSCLAAGGIAASASIVPRNLNTLRGRNHTIRSIDDQGRWLLFETAGALVPHDTNGRTDVYRYDIAGGEVALISSGRLPDDAHVAGMTPDGASVFFTTTARLLAADRDGFMDLYVARSGGGYPEPETSSPPCLGEGCRPAAPGIAPAAAAASSTLRGAGNARTRRGRCASKPRKGKHAGKRLERKKSRPCRQRAGRAGR